MEYTNYFGEMSNRKSTPKENGYCSHDMCTVTMSLLATDGSTDWICTVKGSPRWNFSDQTGDTELANNGLDGPYVYVALGDIGEDNIGTLDDGTSYTGCRDRDGKLTPEHFTSPSKVVLTEDVLLGQYPFP